MGAYPARIKPESVCVGSVAAGFVAGRTVRHTAVAEPFGRSIGDCLCEVTALHHDNAGGRQRQGVSQDLVQ
jgi:hypothetical protein